MLKICYNSVARQRFLEKTLSDKDQDDVLYEEALDAWGDPNYHWDIQVFPNGLVRDISRSSNGTYIWRAENEAAELWLMANAPEGYRVMR